ncbi:hypothetical protein SUGI_0715930 [Cryptomeria japonica]|nr:hypothetical protein SUGI_0715930 [Cryptomeria japonica]
MRAEPIAARIEGLDFPGNDYARLSFTNESACQQACIGDCYCTVVIYGLFNATETCWKKATPLRFSLPSDSRTVYIKVYSGVSNAVSPNPPKESKEDGKALTVIGISLIGCSFVFAAILLLIWLYTCRKLGALQENQNANPVGLKAFSYREIDAATGGFKQEIGRGAFGKIYKGVLPDGRAIAVKKLDDLPKQGLQDEENEFSTEMGTIRQSHHKNLVQLYGFCTEDSHMLLI